MATYSTLGVGSGIDLQGLLTKLMAAERTPITLIESKISTTNSKISAFGVLKSKLDTLQSASDDLRYSTRLAAKTATSSDSTVASATATTSAINGSYSLDVTQLASAQKSFTTAYSAGTTFGQGELSFTVGGVTTPITLDDQTSYTLEEVGSRINAANVGVTATVITASDGAQRMVLTGKETGSGNGFSLTSTLTASDSQASLDSFDTTTTGLMRQDAQDALMSIDGIEVSSSTNVFASALPGVSITAAKVGTSSLTVSNNDSHVIDSAQAFVDAYNAVISNISSNTGYDESSSSGKAFSGDFAIRAVTEGLRSVRMNEPAGVADSSFKALSDLGITVQRDGTLKLDTTKLQEALDTSSDDVITTLNAYGDAFSTELSSKLSSSGAFTSRLDSLNNSVQKMQDNIDTMEIRLALTEKRYRAQFTALDQYVASMQSTSTYLTQQISSLTSSSS